MSDNKKYHVPEEIIDISLEFENYIELRDIYAKLPFCFKKAKKCGLLAKQKKMEFWSKIREIYPELDNKELSFSSQNYVYVVNNAN